MIVDNAWFSAQIVFDNEKMNAKLESHLEKNGELQVPVIYYLSLFTKDLINIINVYTSANSICLNFLNLGKIPIKGRYKMESLPHIIVNLQD